MNSIADGLVIIQSTPESVPSTPCWFGEVVLVATYLRQHGILTKISEQVRFARRRFGHYEVIDFVAVLLGYAISGECTLQMFYERLEPFAVPFMALFGRHRLPARSTLSRFLTALTAEPIEALRTLVLEDLLERRADFEQHPCGLTDRTGKLWKVFDIDGTREAARQRPLPKREEQPAAQRRLDEVCAPGYTGRKRGEVVRTRSYLRAHQLKDSPALLRPCGGNTSERLDEAADWARTRWAHLRTVCNEATTRRLYGFRCRGVVFASWLL
jgi:hypothetical protein